LIFSHGRLCITMVAVHVLACSAALVSAVSEDEWASWKNEFGRTYNDDAEDAYRRKVFEANLEIAAQHQQLNPEAEFGATIFSDRTPEEFKVYVELCAIQRNSTRI